MFSTLDKQDVSVIFFIHLAIDCGPLLQPQNGTLLGSSTVFPNVVTFRCDEGFLLRGSTSRTCQANGTWNGVGTTCEGTFEVYGNYLSVIMVG